MANGELRTSGGNPGRDPAALDTRTSPPELAGAPARPLRICMVTDNYYPYIGGIAEHVHHLSVELRKRGHTVKILTSNFDSRTVECLDAVPEEEHIRRIGVGLLIRSNKSFARLPVMWRPVAKCREYFRDEGFDVIHIHGSLAPTFPMASINASRAVNVLTFHAGHDQSLGYALFRTQLKPYFNALHGLIAVSETAKSSCDKYFRGPYRIIPNAIDLDFFRPDAPRMPELPEGRPRILFVGRFEPRKGLKYLLMALPEIVRQVPDVELVVVGTGLLGYSYKGYLDGEVEKHVRWAGLIPGEDRPRYYASCDVYCSPAIGFESFGIVLLEAMATCRPIVASSIQGYGAVMADGEQGILVPPRDVSALAQALVRVLKDKALARRLGEAGRRRAHEFSWPVVAQRVESVYEELVRRYPEPRYGREDD
jgi:phosphatidyl-myo-inositol alpha-mannosyltransferase